MAAPASISIKQLAAAARGSAEEAFKRQGLAALKPGYVVGFVPPHWWLGIVIRNPDAGLTVVAAEKVASDVYTSVAGSVPAVHNGTAGIVVGGGHVTIGFAPPPGVEVTE